MYQYISIGGWCGTRTALDLLKITNEPHNIFDHLRSSSRGIIECVENDFTTFFPENKEIDTRFENWKPIIGEHFGFFHSGSLTDPLIIDSFNRKKDRFVEHCKSDKKCVFVRTCIIPQYEDELEDMKIFQEVMTKKYPTLSFIIIFIIPDQDVTTYYSNATDKIFVFCLNDKSNNWDNLGVENKNIFDFIRDNNLFETIPPPNETIQILKPTTKYFLVDNLPSVHYHAKYL